VATRLPSAPPVLSGYTYVRPLGTGGFADVFLFEQNMPRRAVAVKVLLQDVIDDDVLRLFNAEADVMARLSSHPSILTVYNAGISADGRPFLVMEFCPSSPGAHYRRQPLSVPDALTIGVKIACALETAHRSGLLHRDVKPSNILATSFGSPVLADFGIATSLASVRHDELLAMSVPWSAPEVVNESTSGSVPTEVWSFGATIYSLLAGRPPFESVERGRNSRDQQKQRIGRAKYTPVGRADVPDALDAALARMMSRDPAHRQATLLECAQDLQRVQHALGIMPTALEVAVDEWAAAGTPIDFSNTAVRGTVISEVAFASRRSRDRAKPVRPSMVEDEGTRLAEADRRRPGLSGVKLAMVLGGVLVLGGGLAFGAVQIMAGL